VQNETASFDVESITAPFTVKIVFVSFCEYNEIEDAKSNNTVKNKNFFSIFIDLIFKIAKLQKINVKMLILLR